LQHCGGGTYALCFRATHLPTGRPVVLKRLRIEQSEEGMPSLAMRELSLMRSLEGSPHIVQLLDVLHDPHAGPAGDQARVFLVLESLDRDLRAHLDLEPGAARQLPFVKSAMYQVLSALAHAHARTIMHRDLKPHNILLDRRTGTVKVGDWGLARTTNPGAPRPHTREVQTLLYRAPELLLGAELYSLPIDMWSCGCILAELATGLPLFQADTQLGMLMAIFQLLGTPDEAQWPGITGLPDWSPQFPRFRARGLAQAAPQLGPVGLELLSRMLCYDPARRITARQALAHPWFDSVRSAEEARGRTALLAAQQLRQEMQLPPRAPAGAGSSNDASGSGARGSRSGPPTTPVAMQGHLLSCEASASPRAPPQT
jgi:cyclin-dependent kinase 2